MAGTKHKNMHRDPDTGLWCGDFTIAGRRYRPSLRTADAAEAKKRLQKEKDKITAAVFYGEETHTWEDTVVKWEREHLSTSLKPKTAKRYLVSARQIAPYFEGRAMETVTVKDVAKFVSNRLLDEVTNATIRRDLTAFSSVLRCTVGWGWRDNNPAKLYDRSLIKEIPFIIDMPDDEAVEEMLTRGSAMFMAATRFLGETGARQDEAVTLEWPQINLLRAQALFLETKSSKPRTINLAPQTVRWLSKLPRFIKDGKASPIVFWHDQGEPYRNFSSRFAALNAGNAEQRDLAFRCHDLRHRYAVTELKSGRDIYDLKSHLGHSSVKTTERYLAWIKQEDKRREIDWHEKNNSEPVADPASEISEIEVK